MTDQVKPQPPLSDEEIEGVSDTIRRTFSGADAPMPFLRLAEAVCAQAKRYPAMVEALEIAKENFEHFCKPSFYAQYIASPSTCESLAHGAQVAIKQLEAALKGETPQ